MLKYVVLIMVLTFLSCSTNVKKTVYTDTYKKYTDIYKKADFDSCNQLLRNIYINYGVGNQIRSKHCFEYLDTTNQTYCYNVITLNRMVFCYDNYIDSINFENIANNLRNINSIEDSLSININGKLEPLCIEDSLLKDYLHVSVSIRKNYEEEKYEYKSKAQIFKLISMQDSIFQHPFRMYLYRDVYEKYKK